MNRKSRFLMIGAICLLAIGFAAVATTLTLNGNVTVGSNADDFDVRFTKVKVSDEDSTAEIVENGKKITFVTKELSKVPDSVTLDYRISNFSKNYDVTVGLVVEGLTQEVLDYVDVDMVQNWEGRNDNKILAGTRATGSITITLKKLSEEADSIYFDFAVKMTVNAVSRSDLGDNLVEDVFPIDNPDNQALYVAYSNEDYTDCENVSCALNDLYARYYGEEEPAQGGSGE